MNQVNLKKVTFTIRQVKTIEVEVSSNEGFDMPTNVPELISLVNDIQSSPCEFTDHNSEWELESSEAINIEYFDGE